MILRPWMILLGKNIYDERLVTSTWDKISANNFAAIQPYAKDVLGTLPHLIHTSVSILVQMGRYSSKSTGKYGLVAIKIRREFGEHTLLKTSVVLHILDLAGQSCSKR